MFEAGRSQQGEEVVSALVNAIVMLGMLVVVPAGLRLTGQHDLNRVRTEAPEPTGGRTA